jgi:hypothetical protein
MVEDAGDTVDAVVEKDVLPNVDSLFLEVGNAGCEVVESFLG